MIYLGVALVLIAFAGVAALYTRTRPRPNEYSEMEARKRAIDALHRI